jgi:hypothetical protein
MVRGLVRSSGALLRAEKRQVSSLNERPQNNIQWRATVGVEPSILRHFDHITIDQRPSHNRRACCSGGILCNSTAPCALYL